MVDEFWANRFAAAADTNSSSAPKSNRIRARNLRHSAALAGSKLQQQQLPRHRANLQATHHHHHHHHHHNHQQQQYPQRQQQLDPSAAAGHQQSQYPAELRTEGDLIVQVSRPQLLYFLHRQFPPRLVSSGRRCSISYSSPSLQSIASLPSCVTQTEQQGRCWLAPEKGALYVASNERRSGARATNHGAKEDGAYSE